MKRFGQSRHLRCILSSAAFISVLFILSYSAYSSCRDPDVARRGFTSPAYAANVDATIQYFGHSFFLITTSKGTRIVTDPSGTGMVSESERYRRCRYRRQGDVQP